MKASAPAAAPCSVRTPLARRPLTSAALLAAVLHVRQQAVQHRLRLCCWARWPGRAAGLAVDLRARSGKAVEVDSLLQQLQPPVRR